MTAPRPAYVCGHSGSELSRLALQGVFFEAITRRALAAAGIAPGMRVLDIGCGGGDLSLLTASLVGPSGRVVGIDREPAAVNAAASRAARDGLHHVEFHRADVEIDGETLAPLEPFDAMVGRFVLMHQAEPARMLRAAARHLRTRGIVLMIESHLRAAGPGVHSQPDSPAYDRIMTWMREVIGRSGAHVDMGLRLGQTYVAAGLPSPAMALEARVEGGTGAAIYRYTIESVRSMLPAATRLGIAPPGEGDLTTLETALRDEVVATGGVLVSPLVVSAWCRTPA